MVVGIMLPSSSGACFTGVSSSDESSGDWGCWLSGAGDAEPDGAGFMFGKKKLRGEKPGSS